MAQSDDDDLLGGLGGGDDEDLFGETNATEPDPEALRAAEAEKAAKAAAAAKAAQAAEARRRAAAEEIKAQAVTAAAAAAAAEDADEDEDGGASDPRLMDRVKSVPRKPVIKRMRAELTPQAALSLNDPYFNHYGVGGALMFYPHDNFGIGASALYLFAHDDTDNVAVIRQGQTSVMATLEPADLFASVDFQWVPIYGKISLFDSAIVHFDFYALAGFGVARTGDRMQVTAAPGVGQRFVINDWLAFRIELRDYLYMDTRAVNTQSQSDIQNYLMLQAGLSAFIPPSFEYSGF